MTSPDTASSTAVDLAALRTAVRRFIGARVRNDALADDLTQDVFARVIRELPRLRDTNRMTGWIFQISRNVVTDHFRRLRPTEPFDEQADASVALPEAFDREEARLRAELGAYIRSVVEGLPPLYREAIILTDYEGLSQVELARRIGLSVSAAKSRVQRARRMVRKTLEACCRFETDRYGTVVDCVPPGATCGCEGTTGDAG